MKVWGSRRKSEQHKNRTEHYDFIDDEWYCQPFDEQSVTSCLALAEHMQMVQQCGEIYELELRIVPKGR